jgi:hypothetical protein
LGLVDPRVQHTRQQFREFRVRDLACHVVLEIDLVHEDDVPHGIDDDELTEVAGRHEDLAGKPEALGIRFTEADPPHVAIAAARPDRRIRGGARIHPFTRNELLAAPAAAPRHQQPDPRHVAGREAHDVRRMNRHRLRTVASCGREVVVLHLQRFGEVVAQGFEYRPAGGLPIDGAGRVEVPVVVVEVLAGPEGPTCRPPDLHGRRFIGSRMVDARSAFQELPESRALFGRTQALLVVDAEFVQRLVQRHTPLVHLHAHQDAEYALARRSDIGHAGHVAVSANDHAAMNQHPRVALQRTARISNGVVELVGRPSRRAQIAGLSPLVAGKILRRRCGGRGRQQDGGGETCQWRNCVHAASARSITRTSRRTPAACPRGRRCPAGAILHGG